MLNGFIVVIAVIFLWVWALHELFYRLSGFFKPLSTHPKWSLFIAHLVIGLGVFFSLTVFQHDLPWLTDAADTQLDWAMPARQQDIPPAKAKNIPPFVFLDIDAQTQQLWDEPLFTSRQKVKELIEIAVNGGARLVVVDLDLSQKTATQQTAFEGLKPFLWKSRRETFQSTPYDQALYDFIANYKTRCQQTGCPPLILKRVFRPLPGGDKDKNQWYKVILDGLQPAGSEEPIRESLPSFLDEAVAKSTPYVQWAAPLWVRSDRDDVIRRGWLWQLICTDKQPKVIPSIPLLAAALIRHETPQLAQQSLNNALAPFKQAHCSESYKPQSVLSQPLAIANGLVIPEGTHIRQPIKYHLDWQSPQNRTEEWLRYFLQDAGKEHQTGEVILTVLSAQPYLDSPKAGKGLKDNIVLIGSSYIDRSEMPVTPLGTMPSGLIIINALHSLLQYGASQPATIWDHLVWAILLILVVSTILIVIESFWVVVFIGIGVILLIPLGAFLLGGTIWITLALALFAVHVHQIAANYRDKAIKLKLREQAFTKEIKKSLAKDSTKLVKEMAKEMEHSLSKQIEDFVIDDLPKTMEKSEQMVDGLAGSDVPSPQKTHSKSEKVRDKKPGGSIFDNFRGPKQKTTESKEANQQKPTDETVTQDSDGSDDANKTDAAQTPQYSDGSSESKSSQPGVDETATPDSDGSNGSKKNGVDETAVQDSDGSSEQKTTQTGADGTAAQVSDGSSDPSSKKKAGLTQLKAQFSRVLIINMVVGLSLALVLLSVSRFGVMDAEDANMDFLMEINQNIIPPIQENNVPPMVFLDIDNDTHSKWGKPMLTPRKRLKNLITAAVAAKARLVIVDIDLTRQTPVDGSQLHPDDEALKNYLDEYARGCYDKTNASCPLIILKRTFSTELNPIPIVRESFLDDVVTQSTHLQWASALFEAEDDHVVRRQKLWQPACTSDKEQPLVVPSLELLAMAQLKNCTVELQNALNSFLPTDCHSDYVHQPEQSAEICGLTVSAGEKGDINNPRIIYRLSWLVDDKPPSLPYRVKDESEKTVLEILSAHPYAESTPPDNLESLTDKIVVIGGSYDERNIDSTPLGKMPDTLIIGNALYSLLLPNKTFEPQPIVDVLEGLLIMVVFIVVISLLFVFFPSVWGMVFWGIVIILGLLPISMVFFYYGMSSWLYFALPLVVIIVYLVLLAATKRVPVPA